MDTPLMDEIERRVFFRSPPVHQQHSFSSGLATTSSSRTQPQPSTNSYHPPITRNGRLRMLTSFLSNGSSSTPAHPGNRSGEGGPEQADGALPRSLRHIRSFESSAYSVIDIPTSPNAEQEFNGLARIAVMNSSDAAACSTFKPLPPPPPSQPHSGLELEQRWRSKSYKPQSIRLKDHRDSVYCLEFDSIHNVLVTGSRDKTIKIWSLTTGELRQTLKDHHSGSVLCLKVIASEGFMVSGSSDRTIIVWELSGLGRSGGEVTGTVKRRLNGHAGGVLDLRVDANWIVSWYDVAKLFASNSKDAVVRVWSRHTLEPHCDLMGHEGPVNAVGLQGDHVISASGDGKMILWDLKTRSRVRTFEGHDRGLACVEFKDDHIISGSNDRKIKIWSASTGECLHTMSGHDLLVRAISFDAGSGKLVSASYDKTVKVWDLEFSETEQQVAPAQRDGGGSAGEAGVMVVGKKKTVTATCVREFKDYHTSHIFDVKFDAKRI
ncbi:hypothetical protein FRB90_006916, partial [Tulasnella sp. 427]